MTVAFEALNNVPPWALPPLPKCLAPRGVSTSPPVDSAPLASTTFASQMLESTLELHHQTLSTHAASIYSRIASKSILLTNTEAAPQVVTAATSMDLMVCLPILFLLFLNFEGHKQPPLPCQSRVCLENPVRCVPYPDKSNKCLPCQTGHVTCSF
jgi:hypothetical protein